MSMNLHLVATITAKSIVGDHTIRERFDLYQTPTDATYNILSQDDKYAVYVAWGQPLYDIDEVRPIYEWTDHLTKRVKVGEETVNEWKPHVEELAKWLEDHKLWDIEWFVM